MIMEGSLNVLGLKLNCLMPLKLRMIACARIAEHYLTVYSFIFKVMNCTGVFENM